MIQFADYFDRMYVISLVDRLDRRRRISREFYRAGIPLRPGKIEFFDAIRVPVADGFPSPGYHGCFLSHREVLRRASESGSRRTVVFEDDVVLHPDFARRGAAAAHALELIAEWDVVQFGYYPAEPIPGNGLAPAPGRFNPLTGAHFYAVNGSIASRLAAWFDASLDRPAGHPDGGRMSPDGTLNHFRWANPDVRSFVQLPPLGRQSNSPSDIANRSWFDVPFLGPAVRSIRSLVMPERWD